MVIKKKKFRTPLSVLQRKQLIRISLAIVILSLLWLVFAPGSGLLHLRQQKKNLAALVAEQEILVQQNRDMKQDIERLQNDKKYLEQVAREKYGMLKDNEMVFDFAKEKKKK
ncbi:MAG TPA: septum formation initiator family protein [Desulfocapsa sulfexigens]|nr:septum formation initiator family protein [Desulfocapsa sulfexigens]